MIVRVILASFLLTMYVDGLVLYLFQPGIGRKEGHRHDNIIGH